MTDNFHETAVQLAEIGGSFYDRGWVLGTSGNFSAVLNRDPLRLAITPSGADKGALRGEQILNIKWPDDGVERSMTRPSAETLLHIQVVLKRGAGAVLHTHSIWSTVLSKLYGASGGILLQGYEMLKGLEGVSSHQHREWLPIVENSQDMPELAAQVALVLDEYPAAHSILIKQHGLYTWGDNLTQAKRHVEIFEFLLEAEGRLHSMGPLR